MVYQIIRSIQGILWLPERHLWITPNLDPCLQVELHGASRQRVGNLAALSASQIVALYELAGGRDEGGPVLAGGRTRAGLVVVVVGCPLDQVLAVGVVAVGGTRTSGVSG